MGDVRNTISSSLRAHRAAARFSRFDVAEKIGVSPSSIKGWEDGMYAMNIESAISLADLYGVSLDELLGRKVG